ncbi:MAG: twin-arginine translocation signal domain-containing protein, partial [Hyphomicrobiaceae bacterium]
MSAQTLKTAAGPADHAGSTTARSEALLRRDFLKGASVVAAMAVSGQVLLHTTEAWAFAPKAFSAETARTLVKVARDIFPHDKLADQYYGVAVKTYDDKAVDD